MLPFFNEQELIRPQDLIHDEEDFPSTVIMTWQRQFLDAAKARYGVKQIAVFRCGIACPVYEIKLKHETIAMVVLPIGGPVVAGFMEEFRIRGVIRFVAIGYAGSLSPLTAGNIIVPTQAYRDEGTSWHYAPHDSNWMDVKTSQKLDEILNDLDVPHILGRVWTTDSFYRETPSAAKLMKAEKCLCVDMECAAIMAVSQYRKLEVFQMLFSADSLEGERWSIGKLKSHSADTYEMYLELAIKVALS